VPGAVELSGLGLDQGDKNRFAAQKKRH